MEQTNYEFLKVVYLLSFFSQIRILQCEGITPDMADHSLDDEHINGIINLDRTIKNLSLSLCI